MANTKHIHHAHHHASYSYPVHLAQKLYTLFFAPLLAVGAAFLILLFFTHSLTGPSQVSPAYILRALLSTFSRLLIAYIFALVVAIPLAILINVNSLTERIFLPLFDIVQSVPVLAFFPVIIILFVRSHLLAGAAVFIIFLSMLWNLVFSLVGGLRVIPVDIKSAAKVFDIRGFSYLRRVLLPAIFPYIVTGSILAWAQGWNIIIVAEVLHTYIPGGSHAFDLFGIGSLLVQASSGSEGALFISCILTLILTIALINFFIWQKLLRFAERFSFE